MHFLVNRSECEYVRKLHIEVHSTHEVCSNHGATNEGSACFYCETLLCNKKFWTGNSIIS